MGEACLEILESCYKSHHRCEQHTLPCLPSRVIDVGAGDSAIEPKLHISKKYERAKYACLSYCWGGPQQCCTTKATLENNIEGLEFENLARTLQDAIKVTRMLKLRYLWVDALCIVQDDAADKELQLQYMGINYKYATVTIAAASGDNVHDGFLGNWSTDDEPVILPNLMPLDNEAREVKVVRSNFYDSSGWPLNNRAWALQEYLLSPRLLIFGTGGPVWQCQTQHLKPLFPTNKLFMTNLRRLPDEVFSTTQAALLTPNREEQHSSWKFFVENYSSRKITYPSDRPYAIAGIISELSRVWIDQCNYGVWRSNLVDQLCWVTWNPRPQSTFNAVLGVPSWSWIRVNSTIMYTDANIRQLSEKTDVARCVAFPSSDSPNLVLAVPLLPTNEMSRQMKSPLFASPISVGRDIDTWLERKSPQISYIKVGYLAVFLDFEIDETWDEFAYAALEYYGYESMLVAPSFFKVITKHVLYSILHWPSLAPTGDWSL